MPEMEEQKIKASELERQIIATRAREAEYAEAAFQAAQQASNENFTLFCEGKGLPRGCMLVGVDREHVILRVPKEPLQPAAE